MYKVGLSLLVLVATFAFGSGKTYAQCAEPTTYACRCDMSNHTGFFVGNGGGYNPSTQAK